MKFVYIIRKRMPSCEQLHAHWTLASPSSLITNAGFGCFRLTVPPLSSHGKDWPGPGAQRWEGRTEVKASCGHAKQRLRHALWLEIKTGLATAERSLKGRSRQKVLIREDRIKHWARQTSSSRWTRASRKPFFSVVICSGKRSDSRWGLLTQSENRSERMLAFLLINEEDAVRRPHNS